MKNSKNSYQYGLWAEHWAAFLLRMKGYKIIAQRYKTPVGEIDLIISRRDVIAFVEVKARKDLAQALHSVTPSMQKRIVRAAEYFLSQTPDASDKVLRFDLVAIAGPFSIEHLDNAWRPAS